MFFKFSNEAKIIFSALSMTIFFFISFHSYIKNNGSYYPETPIDLSYSVYKHNSFTEYRALTAYKDGVRIMSATSKKIPVIEHPGYGWLMGLVWKITGSLKYYDMQFLQIILFVISCLFLYWGLVIALQNVNQALWAAAIVPFFLPLLFLNVNPIRDIYCFYGASVLFYLFIHMYYKQLAIKQTIIGGLFIALCQWMRPTIFGSLALGAGFIFLYSFFYNRKKLKNVSLSIVLLILTTIVAFWVPWALFNKKIHGRYFAAQSGQLLLDSMGWTGPNKINPECSDTNNGLYCDKCVTDYTIRRFNLDTTKIKIGSSEMDDKMKEAFWQWFWKDPAFWFKGMFWRIRKVMFLDMTWSTTPGWNWHYYNSFDKYSDRLQAAYSFGSYHLLEFLFRRWFVRLFMFMGYIGALCLLYNRHYFLLGLLISLTAGGISPAIISHPEHRYLTPFYFIYPICAGYFLYTMFYLFAIIYSKKKQRSSDACFSKL